jgi:DNA-binding HxlR family transcriptional regulator
VDGAARPRPLRGTAPRTLSERLKELEGDEVVVRRSYAETPPRVEYELTPKGEAMLPIIEAMRAYGRAWLPDEHGVEHD